MREKERHGGERETPGVERQRSVGGRVMRGDGERPKCKREKSWERERDSDIL